MADELLLPAGIEDERSRAFLALIDRLRQIDIAPLLVYRVDSVPEPALYALAWQFNMLGLQGWDVADSPTKKRDLIRRAVALHKHKGTVWALREALRAMGFPYIVVEEGVGGIWTDFAVTFGSPADALPIPEARREVLARVIELWKPVRSRLASTYYLSYLHDGTYTYNGDIIHAGVRDA